MFLGEFRGKGLSLARFPQQHPRKFFSCFLEGSMAAFKTAALSKGKRLMTTNHANQKPFRPAVLASLSAYHTTATCNPCLPRALPPTNHAIQQTALSKGNRPMTTNHVNLKPFHLAVLASLAHHGHLQLKPCKPSHTKQNIQKTHTLPQHSRTMPI